MHATMIDASAAQRGTVMKSYSVAHALRILFPARRMRDCQAEDVGSVTWRPNGTSSSSSSSPTNVDDAEACGCSGGEKDRELGRDWVSSMTRVCARVLLSSTSDNKDGSCRKTWSCSVELGNAVPSWSVGLAGSSSTPSGSAFDKRRTP